MKLLEKTLKKNTPIPLYYQLKTSILEEIENGDLKDGDTIPTELQLAQHFSISRSTVRQAISELSNEGWLQRRASKGTFVTHPNHTSNYIHSFEPFYQQISKLNKKPSTELLSLKVIPASSDLAIKMGINEGDQVISMFRRRSSDGIPMVTIQNYMPYQLCSFVLSGDFTVCSLYELLMTHSETLIHETKSVVSADLATDKDVAQLNISTGTPMLCFHNVSRTADGIILDYAFSRYRGDYNKFEFIDTPKKP